VVKLHSVFYSLPNIAMEGKSMGMGLFSDYCAVCPQSPLGVLKNYGAQTN
jgi:hypothetical protein